MAAGPISCVIKWSLRSQPRPAAGAPASVKYQSIRPPRSFDLGLLAHFPRRFLVHRRRNTINDFVDASRAGALLVGYRRKSLRPPRAFHLGRLDETVIDAISTA